MTAPMNSAGKAALELRLLDLISEIQKAQAFQIDDSPLLRSWKVVIPKPIDINRPNDMALLAYNWDGDGEIQVGLTVGRLIDAITSPTFDGSVPGLNLYQMTKIKPHDLNVTQKSTDKSETFKAIEGYLANKADNGDELARGLHSMLTSVMETSSLHVLSMSDSGAEVSSFKSEPERLAFLAEQSDVVDDFYCIDASIDGEIDANTANVGPYALEDLVDQFPDWIGGSAALMARIRKNKADSTGTTLLNVGHKDQDYELLVCGKGDNAYFQWINEGGNPVGAAFQEIADMEQAKADFIDQLASREQPRPRG